MLFTDFAHVGYLFCTNVATFFVMSLLIRLTTYKLLLAVELIAVQWCKPDLTSIVNEVVVGSISKWRNEILIFSFPCSVNKAK